MEGAIAAWDSIRARLNIVEQCPTILSDLESLLVNILCSVPSEFFALFICISVEPDML